MRRSTPRAYRSRPASWAPGPVVRGAESADDVHDVLAGFLLLEGADQALVGHLAERVADLRAECPEVGDEDGRAGDTAALQLAQRSADRVVDLGGIRGEELAHLLAVRDAGI